MKQKTTQTGLLRGLLYGALLCLSASAATAGTVEDLRGKLAHVLPDLSPESIKETPVPGLYEVVVGPRLFYVSADGRYLIQGRMVDLLSREDLTEPAQAKAKLKALDKVGEDNMIIFGPKAAAHTVTVFTDIDCGYCRKLHSEIANYNKEDIRVRYMFFPRAGLNSPSYDKAVSVWCADDRRKALTAAKAGQNPEPKKCDNPVKAHMDLGEQMGVTGTPSLILEDGELLPGYVPARNLAAYLREKADKK